MISLRYDGMAQKSVKSKIEKCAGSHITVTEMVYWNETWGVMPKTADFGRKSF